MRARAGFVGPGKKVTDPAWVGSQATIRHVESLANGDHSLFALKDLERSFLVIFLQAIYARFPNWPTFEHYQDEKEQDFLAFVLSHYIQEGVGELGEEKLPSLLELKYGGTSDAVDILGDVIRIRETFVGFQQYLYAGHMYGPHGE